MQIDEWYFFLHDNLFQTKLENFVVIAFSHMPCGYGSKKSKTEIKPPFLVKGQAKLLQKFIKMFLVFHSLRCQTCGESTSSKSFAHVCKDQNRFHS